MSLTCHFSSPTSKGSGTCSIHSLSLKPDALQNESATCTTLTSGQTPPQARSLGKPNHLHIAERRREHARKTVKTKVLNRARWCECAFSASHGWVGCLVGAVGTTRSNSKPPPTSTAFCNCIKSTQGMSDPRPRRRRIPELHGDMEASACSHPRCTITLTLKAEGCNCDAFRGSITNTTTLDQDGCAMANRRKHSFQNLSHQHQHASRPSHDGVDHSFLHSSSRLSRDRTRQA